MKYHVLTLGCQMNKSDSERVASVIEKMGYSWTDNEDEASLLGVIACSVRQKAIDKVYSRIYKWNRMKNRKGVITFVSGCILPDDRDKFLKLFDLIFQMSELHQLPEMMRQYGIVTPYALQNSIEAHPLTHSTTTGNDAPSFKVVTPAVGKTTVVGQPVLMKQPDEHINEFWQVTPEYQSDYEAFVPIQNGCDKFCTYCAVPYTRGREISRPSHEIVEEVKQLVDKGYKSITLLGQNVNSYGNDKKGEEVTFAGLLDLIGKYGNESGKEFWLYFTSPHPRDMTNDVLETIARYQCLANWIHLPLQSGDDHVLIRMNRKHNLDIYRNIVTSIRQILPSATLFTDIIVGFTGETDAEFENTRKAMEEFQYNMAYIAQYSPRPGAVSARWEDNVPREVKKQRLHILTEELKKHSYAYNQQLVNKTCKVLVTGKDRKKGHLSSLTEGKIIVRFANDDESLIGKFVDVNITSAVEFAAHGKLIEVYA